MERSGAESLRPLGYGFQACFFLLMNSVLHDPKPKSESKADSRSI